MSIRSSRVLPIWLFSGSLLSSLTGCSSGDEPITRDATGGTAGMPAAAGGAGALLGCGFTVHASLSSVIATVGIVDFSVDRADMTSATIEFGLDTDYGLSAPVDLADPSHRTLLLGMKETRTYHFRIVTRGGAGPCESEDYTLATGMLVKDLPEIRLETPRPADLAGGFLVDGEFGGNAFILDSDGDYVWRYALDQAKCHGVNDDGWYCSPSALRMTADGKAVWIADGNVPERSGANVHRVTLDGLEDQDFSEQFARFNHDLVVLPNDAVVFLAYADNGCDDIKQRAPDGTVTILANAGTILGLTACHSNAIRYSAVDDTLVFSELNSNSYVKLTRAGEVVWILGGERSDFSGDGAAWKKQHGVQLLATDRLVFFNNGGEDARGSLVLEIKLDLSAKTAQRVFEYEGEPPIHNVIMGDVQRLPNGNTLVSYATQSVFREITGAGDLVQEITWVEAGIGYGEKRKTLYGPPPQL